MNILNFPNVLTLIRISLIPVFVIVYYLPIDFNYELAAFVFAIAGATDWLDGYLARKLNQETSFGAFCDPVADKLIVVIALMLLLGEYNSLWVTVPSIIIVSRELIISGLREWMAGDGHRDLVSVAYLGKVKTTVQMLSIIVLLSQKPLFDLFLVKTGIFLLILAALLTVWTMFLYLKSAWPKLY